MRLVLMVGALVLCGGAAEARGSSKADGERVCTTVTTVLGGTAYPVCCASACACPASVTT